MLKKLGLLSSLAALCFAACGAPPEPEAPAAPPPSASPPGPAPQASQPPPEASAPPPSGSSSALAAGSASPSAPEPPQKGDDGPCPADMIFVDGTYCPRVERTCLRKEENKPNHLQICHKFEHKTRCLGGEEKRSFCIDKYEYPNKEGAHPPWMVSWYDAQATCASMGKRLCYESEWVTACEGPEHTPFPYGWDRDQTACNIDNVWINPQLSKAYSHDPAVSSAELERLDQSVASGAMPRCVSGYGVHDMTGNFDEWVTSDQKPGPKDKSQWAGLKGGAWGHVRNACRPMTTSHPPDFTYYFISFRCCADAKGQPVYEPKAGVPAPKVKPADRAPLPKVINPTGPSKRKVQPEN